MNSILETTKELEEKQITPNAQAKRVFEKYKYPAPKQPITLKKLLSTNEATWELLESFHPSLHEIEGVVREQVEIQAKYATYIEREMIEIERVSQNEDQPIPSDFDFAHVPNLSHEIREKLERIQPKTLGQASRISGVTPAAVAILNIFLRRHRETGRRAQANAQKPDHFDGFAPDGWV
jgi:tRNA uridine 5-carboxymethylaminomethyl modification enzyme